MKSRALFFLVVLILLVCGMTQKPVTCLAATESGTDENGIVWRLDENGTITLNGQHVSMMYHQGLYESYPKLVGWGTHKDEIKKIIIEYGAESVGGCYEMPLLTSVSIPDSVTLLQLKAFGDCPNLVDITLPDSVLTISAYAFHNCSSLLQMKLPAHLTEINEELFFGCTSLTSVEIPDGVTEIKRIAFGNCVCLRQINLPDSIVSIEDSVFANCQSLTDIILPTGLKRISEYTFAGCANLSTIVIKNDVTVIEAYAFAGCNELTDIYYTGSQTQWDAITIDPTHNEALTRARIHYNYVPDQTPQEEAMLDVNGWLDDNRNAGDVSGYGTFDVHINGKLVKNDVNDFYESVQAGSTYEIRDIRANAGHVYKGVTEGSISGSVRSGGTINIRLKFLTVYDIQYNKNTTDSVRNMPGQQQKEYGASKTLSSNSPTRSGYTFQGWATSASSSTVSYKPGALYTKNATITLYAVWKKDQVSTVSTVMLDVNGWLDDNRNAGDVSGYGTFDVCINGKLVKNDVNDFYESVQAGSTYEIRDIRANAGHVYKGVTEGSISGTVRSGGTINIRLKFLTVYDIQYNKNTTDSVRNMPGQQQKEYGASKTLSSNSPTRSGYTFQGWATSASSSTVSYRPGALYTKNANITLYAVWKKDQVSTVSTVMLDVNGWLDDNRNAGDVSGYGTFDVYINGKLVKNDVNDFYESVQAGSTYEIRDIRANAGHVYKGVTEGSISGTVRSGGTNNIRLKFLTVYDIQYNKNTTDSVRNMPGQQQKEYGASKTLSSNSPTRSGYTFQGWATSASSSTVSYRPGALYTKNANITLYAVWKKDQAETGAVVRSGKCGDSLTWTLGKNGTLTVSGVGDMADFNHHGAPWYNERNSIQKVVIAEGVTSVGNNAFDYLEQLESVSLPDSLKKIGEKAFSATEKLPSIMIPKNVSEIGWLAFVASNGLKTFFVAADNPYYSAWNGLLLDKQKTKLLCCPAGKEGTVTLPNTVKSIGDAAFRGCLKIEGVNLPVSLTSIGEEAFWDCRSMTAITIPNSVSSIGKDAFIYCENLTITVTRNSYAEKYCKNNKLKYISQIKKGDHIFFGTYPQTAAGNDKKKIEWLVLEVKGNEALVISRYGLDAKPYHNTTRKPVTWETCTLRSWLNNDFLNKAFSAAERNAILTTEVDNSRNHGYQGPKGFQTVNAGNNTQDKVFLLSIAEANQYFGVTWEDTSNTSSRIEPTPYAVKQGHGTADEALAEWRWWWLRSPGNSQVIASVVAPAGSLYASYVVRTHFVRPALWLNLNTGTITRQQ